MKIDALDVVCWAIGIILLLVTSMLSYQSCTVGRKSEDYKTICIKGHEYYVATFGTKMALSINLDEDGKPVKCQVND